MKSPQFDIGDKIKIVAPADADPCMEPDEGPTYVGLTGVIADSYEYCGYTMFSVKLSDGRTDGFWAEEMERI